MTAKCDVQFLAKNNFVSSATCKQITNTKNICKYKIFWNLQFFTAPYNFSHRVKIFPGFEKYEIKYLRLELR